MGIIPTVPVARAFSMQEANSVCEALKSRGYTATRRKVGISWVILSDAPKAVVAEIR